MRELLSVLNGLLTPTIAGVAVGIAYQQWKTNDLKVRIDLFDKRIEVYDAAADLLYQAISKGDLTWDQLREFSRKWSAKSHCAASRQQMNEVRACTMATKLVLIRVVNCTLSLARWPRSHPEASTLMTSSRASDVSIANRHVHPLRMLLSRRSPTTLGEVSLLTYRQRRRSCSKVSYGVYERGISHTCPTKGTIRVL